MHGIYLLPPALLATLASNPALAICSSNNDLCMMGTSGNIKFHAMAGYVLHRLKHLRKCDLIHQCAWSTAPGIIGRHINDVSIQHDNASCKCAYSRACPEDEQGPTTACRALERLN